MSSKPNLSTIQARTPATTWDGEHQVLPSARAQFRGSDVPEEAQEAPLAANLMLVELWRVIADFRVKHCR